MHQFRNIEGLKRGDFAGQDLSTAGARLGMDGKRSVLFWQIMRVATQELPQKARYIFLENVPGIRTLALRQVAGALSDAGYDARWTTLRVSAIGGHHRRERWFCLARLRPPPPVAHAPGPPGEPDDVPELRQPPDGGVQPELRRLAGGPAYQTGLWLREPGIPRVVSPARPAPALPCSSSNNSSVVAPHLTSKCSRACSASAPSLIFSSSNGSILPGHSHFRAGAGVQVDGVPSQLDRCRLRRNHMLGNAVCPPQALFAFRALAGLGPYPAKLPAAKRELPRLDQIADELPGEVLE